MTINFSAILAKYTFSKLVDGQVMSVNVEKSSYPTVGQLERDISQKIRSMYRNEFGHQPSKVECHLLGNKLLISLEDVITTIEKFLLEGESLLLVDYHKI